MPNGAAVCAQCGAETPNCSFCGARRWPVMMSALFVVHRPARATCRNPPTSWRVVRPRFTHGRTRKKYLSRRVTDPRENRGLEVLRAGWHAQTGRPNGRTVSVAAIALAAFFAFQFLGSSGDEEPRRTGSAPADSNIPSRPPRKRHRKHTPRRMPRTISTGVSPSASRKTPVAADWPEFSPPTPTNRRGLSRNRYWRAKGPSSGPLSATSAHRRRVSPQGGSAV